MTDYPRWIASLLADHVGRAQAISVAQLSHVTGLSARSVKQHVHDLRLKGVRIGSARMSDGEAVAGYFMLTDGAELALFLRTYRSQAMSELKVIQAMLQKPLPALGSLGEQLDLHLGVDDL